jgi:hypothetical protein
MKSLITLATLLTVALAAPAPATETATMGDPESLALPAGWVPIASEEVRRRMTTSQPDENNVLRKRSPGSVRDPRPLHSCASRFVSVSQWLCAKGPKHVGLYVHRLQLGKHLRLVHLWYLEYVLQRPRAVQIQRWVHWA